MVPADDQAIALPWTSVMVIIVLLNFAFTCATPELMFLRSRRRTRVASLPILDPLPGPARSSPLSPEARRVGGLASLLRDPADAYFFFPAIGRAGPLRVRALVWVRWPRTGSPRRCRKPR